MNLKIVVRIAVAAVVCLASLFTTVPAQAASSTYGCPRGDVCMWAENVFFHDAPPVKTWYHYGTYNLHAVYGRHWVMDNQWGYAYVIFYTGYNGTGDCFGFNTVNSGPGVDEPYMTPINSIGLSTYLPSRCDWA